MELELGVMPLTEVLWLEGGLGHFWGGHIDIYIDIYIYISIYMYIHIYSVFLCIYICSPCGSGCWLHRHVHFENL